MHDTASIFYFAYLGAQYPAGYALQKLPIGKVIGVVTISMMETPIIFLFIWG